MKKVLLAMFVAVLALAMVSTNVLAKGAAKGAAKAEKTNATSVTGTLALVKDADGKATGATITTKSGTVYTLTSLTGDEADLDGKEVSAKGTLKDAEGKMSLTVNGKITAATEKKEKAAKKKNK